MNFLNLLRVMAAPAVLAVSLLAVSAETPLILPNVALPNIPKNVVKLTDCGGNGDGRTLNTVAFETALAKLSENGGGELVVPPGIWLTGPIKLRSHINLQLERGALIQFSRDYKLYPLTVIDLKGEQEVDSTSPISGVNLENIAITGEGIIDGGGDAWRPLKKDKLGEHDWKALVKSGGVLNEKGDTWYPSRDVITGEKLVEKLRNENSLNPADYEPAHQFLRPKMLRLVGCKKVLLQGVTFQNPPNWTMNPALCEDVSILNVTVHNSPAAQNSDALDLESCRRAIIRSCNFDTGDDGICLKSGKDAAGRRIGVPTEDVLVEGCTVYHAHGGFTIGSEMSGGVRNIRVDNCTFIGTDVGFALQEHARSRRRGGKNLRFECSHGGHSRRCHQFQFVLRRQISLGGNRRQPGNEFPTGHGSDASIPRHPYRKCDLPWRAKGNRAARPAGNAHSKQHVEKCFHHRAGRRVGDGRRRNSSFENVRVENKTGPQLNQLRVKNSSLDLLK
jgi:hypothetical protein